MIIRYNGIGDGVSFTPIYPMIIQQLYKDIKNRDVELVQDTEAYNVRGVPADNIFSDSYKPYINDLGTIDLNNLKLDFTKAPKADIMGTVTALGCKYHCTYCPSSEMQYQVRNTDAVIAEIQEISEETEYFEFFDNNVLANPNFLDIIDHIPKECTWGALINIENLTPMYVHKLRMMYEAGCRRVYFGLETFNKKDLEYLGKPYYKLGQVDPKAWMYYLKEVIGFDLMAFVMRGLPNYSIDEFNEMLDYLDVNGIHFSIGLFTDKEGKPLKKYGFMSEQYQATILKHDEELTEIMLKEFLNLE